MLKVEAMGHVYGQHTAVEGLSFEATQGEVLGLLGPNGAGKTTTLKVLAGLITPTHGRVLVHDFDMVTERLQAQSHLGYLPEMPPFYPHLTVHDNLRFVSRLRQIPVAQQAEKIALAAARCHLEDVLLTYPHRLSRGYRQRLGFAMALVHEPAVLILDEPTTGLDPSQIQATRELIRSLKQHHTLILSSHLLSEVEALCDRVIILHHGKMRAQGTPESLRADKRPAFVLRIRPGEQAQTPLADVLNVLQALPGIQTIRKVQALAHGEQVLRCEVTRSGDQVALVAPLLQQGWDLLTLSPDNERSLESIFLEMVEEIS
jgi:ABC-2 type transport system ATP-binding protein